MNGYTNSDLSIPQILFRKKREKAIDKDNNLENRKEIMQVKKNLISQDTYLLILFINHS